MDIPNEKIDRDLPYTISKRALPGTRNDLAMNKLYQ
jgi:hypothetical protein